MQRQERRPGWLALLVVLGLCFSLVSATGGHSKAKPLSAPVEPLEANESQNEGPSSTRESSPELKAIHREAQERERRASVRLLVYRGRVSRCRPKARLFGVPPPPHLSLPPLVC